MDLLYERYYSGRKLQNKVIADNDFTYQTILRFLQKYGIQSKKVLDLGCGVGTVDFYLAKKGAVVLGIDISQKVIEIATKNARDFKLNKVKFKIMNFPKSVPNGKFDIIICTEVLEHLRYDKLAIQKIETLSHTGSIIIVSSPSQNAPLHRMGLLKSFDKEVGHLRRYTIESYISLFKDYGFKILETKKTEGILRNFLFTNSFGGFLLRILSKWPFSGVVSFIDDLTIPIFGESNLYLVAQKK